LLHHYLPVMKNLSAGEKIHLMGYCMGGCLALALTQLAQEHIKSLTLLATPWHMDALPAPEFRNTYRSFLENLIEKHTVFSGDTMHLLLYFANPFAVHHRLRRLASKQQKREDMSLMLAREYWLHRGVSLPQNIARELMLNWACDNKTAKNQWRVGDEIINPQAIHTPTMLISGSYDKLVPEQASNPLKKHIAGAKHLLAPTGHLGMVASQQAERHVWQHIIAWLNNT
jgi:polyhydroxyalkanoate synthase subunit PhaC